MEKKNIGIWIRVSTEKQVEGESPEHHEQRARYYAETKGWNVVEVYRLDAMSGKSVMDYAETRRMLNDIKTKKIDGLIFSKLARLARNTKELLDVSDFFQEHKADLVSLGESIDTSTPAGRLFYTMLAAMATWEREEIAERVAASIPIRAQLGKPLSGTAQYGYKWQGKEFVIDETEAPIRKLMYEIFLETRRKRTTATKLNEMGYRTRNGSKFGYSSVLRLIKDSTAKGIRVSNFTTTSGKLKPESEWIIHLCPPIVSEELWDKCNAIINDQIAKKAKMGPRAVHLLSGFIQCENNHKMYVFHKDKLTHYRCPFCNLKIPVADIDEIFHEQLKTFLLTEFDISEFMNQNDSKLQEKIALLENTQTTLIKLRKEIRELVDLRLKGDLTSETLRPLIKPVEEQVEQLEHQLPQLEAEVDFLKIENLSSETVLQNAKDLYNNWKSLPFEEKRAVVELITKDITVSKSTININLSYLPNTHNFQNSVKKLHSV